MSDLQGRVLFDLGVMMNKFLSLLLLSVALLLSACSTILPSEYVLTQDRLNDKLAQKFPVSREAGQGVLRYRVTLSSPALAFSAEQNRMAFAVNYSATTALRVSLDGLVAVSGTPYYVPAQRALYLRDVQVNTLKMRQDFAGVLELLRPHLTRMLDDYMKENPLHRFEPDELSYKGVAFEIEAVDVVSNGIRFKFKK
ncbi:MAG: DUF1439 domain-containing protein [Sideroxydans sp.]|nr:DUF1439 domain-containing protein [Sideroxydans sp.]